MQINKDDSNSRVENQAKKRNLSSAALNRNIDNRLESLSPCSAEIPSESGDNYTPNNYIENYKKI